MQYAWVRLDGYHPPRYEWRVVSMTSSDREVERINNETQRMLALADRLDAESALLSSQLQLARKRAEFAEVLALPATEIVRIEYAPAVSLKTLR